MCDTEFSATEEKIVFYTCKNTTCFTCKRSVYSTLLLVLSTLFAVEI